jgi:hypothetical protein
MKIYVDGWLHHKNKRGMELMSGDELQFHLNFDPNIKYDWIMNLSDIKDYPNYDKFIFGPQIMFPSIDENKIPKDKKVYFNVLSKWMVNLCENIHNDYNFIDLPFAVDVDKFKPNSKTGKPIIYFKQRDPKILADVTDYLGGDFIIFDYIKKYNENDYINAISNAPYIIWIGRHESQGFALQEALSCDCPVFVIDVRSKREENHTGSFWHTYLPGHELKATSASYFDDTCGLICYPENWKENWNNFITNLENYKPREFVVENLSPLSCVKKWINKLDE